MSILDRSVTNLKSVPIFQCFYHVPLPRSERSFQEKRSRNDTLHFQLIPHCRIPGGLNRSFSSFTCKIGPTARRPPYFLWLKNQPRVKYIQDSRWRYSARNLSAWFTASGKNLYVRVSMCTSETPRISKTCGNWRCKESKG